MAIRSSNIDWIYQVNTAGENSRTAKLDQEKVFRILELHRQGLSQRKIAQELIVSVGTVNRIVTGRGWKSILPK